MTFWMIILCVGILLVVLGVLDEFDIIELPFYNEYSVCWGIIMIILSLIIIVMSNILYTSQAARFNYDKAYIENDVVYYHNEGLHYMDIESIKVSDNRWLAEQQLLYSEKPIFSFANGSIMELEPIR